MVWRRIFGRGQAPTPPPAQHHRAEAEVADGARTATHGGAVPLPSRARPGQPAGAERERRRTELLRRRDAVLYDIEQGELALSPDNPWQERIDLLTESLATVAADRKALDAATARPTHPLPPAPVESIVVAAGDQAEVTFRIGGEVFRFAEEIDWDNRGGMVVRGDLRHEAGDAAAIVPPDTPPDLRGALADHLAGSLAVFAIDLRDRALAGDPPPVAVTLADLARPDPEVGGWRDWHGNNPVRSEREHRRQQLRAEADHLETERTAEAEQRHTLADRLPIARRRLADIDDDLAALDG
ncbi:MAG: hypothetical protein AVDCRST_MAG49-822 [uncultured Thermomicrobiales bacterium]|uniref:Uncharacterized protein n=1 Tax=uncultured Thermomicrobiales bacterium TaxID=1645740 RepID=A0A6J4U813_9BACT|nr:MAG: hypothetical protein AVDCRST_MAG49-822 [uncultured Thermomicrobiales bacterium]